MRCAPFSTGPADAEEPLTTKWQAGKHTQQHLEILGEIAELLSNASLREQMKSTTNAEQLHQLIDSWQSSAHSSTTVHA